MNHVKLIVLGFTLLLFFLISKNCPRKEGLTNIFQDNPALKCEDDLSLYPYLFPRIYKLS